MSEGPVVSEMAKRWIDGTLDSDSYFQWAWQRAREEVAAERKPLRRHRETVR